MEEGPLSHVNQTKGVDAHGKVHASYNTAGMFTGLADHSGRYETWHNTHAR